MQKTRVMALFGTRPEGIKLAPVIKELEKRKEQIELSVCSTGQHQQMLAQVLDFFEIKPDIDLGLMVQNQSLAGFSAKLLDSIDDVFTRLKPDIVLVQGDTTTAFLTALAAFYKNIKVGHVEAGLRTYNSHNPFPEEINRQFISRIADFNFVPTKKASENLLSEKVEPGRVFLTGNTIVDALEWSIGKIKANKNLIESRQWFKQVFGDKTPSGSRVLLVTMHRRESFGDEIKNICEALKSIAVNYSNLKIVYPVHLNPNVKKPVSEILSGIDNVYLIEPLGYEDFIWLMYNSYLIVTDSGGVQEEAPTLKKPVLVIRKYTERMESVEAGFSRLVGTGTRDIINSIKQLLDDGASYRAMLPTKNPYGDGKASARIAEVIIKNFNKL